MKIASIEVPFYKWVIKAVLLQNTKDNDKILRQAKKIYNMPQDHINDLKSALVKLPYNGARVYYNEGKLIILIIMFKHTDKKELRGTIIHESSHATDKIIESCGIEGTEARAYLNEYICNNMMDKIL